MEWRAFVWSSAACSQRSSLHPPLQIGILLKDHVVEQQRENQTHYKQDDADRAAASHQLVLKALEAPLSQIAENAGLNGAVIVNKVKESKEGIGFDAYTEKYVDMIEDGILDPAKVSRSALQNATSVASSFLTTEAAVATIKEPLPPMPAGGAGMM